MNTGKLLEEIDRLLEHQRVNVIDDEYMHGMYNGMEFIRSMIAETEPLFISSDGSFDPDAILNQPERFI